MYQKSVFTFKDSAPWIAVFFLVSLVFAWAFRAVVWGAGWELWIVNLAVYGAFVALIVRHFVDRARVVRQWNKSEKLTESVALIPHFGPLAADWANTYELWAIPTSVLDKWAVYAFNRLNVAYPDAYKKLGAALQGHTVHIVPDPIKVPYGYAAGVTNGKDITVVGPPNVSAERFRQLIKHELSHVCLFALGVPLEKHHDKMAEVGLC